MSTSDQSRFLGEERIGKLLAKFAVPCVLSLLISALYNIVDQIFIGNSELGYLGNAATSVVFPITIISLAFAWCFGDGAAAYLSISQGRRDTQHTHKCVGGADWEKTCQHSGNEQQRQDLLSFLSYPLPGF